MQARKAAVHAQLASTTAQLQDMKLQKQELEQQLQQAKIVTMTDGSGQVTGRSGKLCCNDLLKVLPHCDRYRGCCRLGKQIPLMGT